MTPRWFSVLATASALSLTASLLTPVLALNDDWPPRPAVTDLTDSIREIGADASVTAEVVPDAYIIQLEAGASLEGRNVQDRSAHVRFHRRAETEEIQYEVRQEFTSPAVFYGLSVTVTDNTTAEVIEKLPEVKKVWPVFLIHRPGPEPGPLSDGVAAAYGWNGTVSRPEGSRLDANLKATNVDKLHELGIRGKGVRVAIIDSGIDYRHPALGGGFGPGKKVAFGRDLLPGAENPNDPLTTCVGGAHGSHVAGILGGEDPDGTGFGIIGVAPEAELGMYRIFNCEGETTTDSVLQAMVAAVSDGADIISMSLGMSGAWQRHNPLNDIVTAITDLDIVVVAAAGNEGTYGPFTGAYPAVSTDAMAIASFDSPHYPLTYEVEDNQGNKYRYSSIWPLSGTLNVWAPAVEARGCALQDYVDAAAFSDANGWERSETVLLLQHGGCLPTVKSVTAVGEFGFHSIVVYSYSNSANSFHVTHPDSIPSFPYTYLIAPDGPALYKAAAANSKDFKLRFTDTAFAPYEQPSAGRVSNFSSFGPTWELEDSKPTVGAPGYSILSTWPLEGGSYAIISGTSMAAPFAAGVVALIKSQFGRRLDARQIHNLIATSGTTPSTSWTDGTTLDSVAQQGSGLLNAWAAFNNAQFVVSKPAVPLRSSDTTVSGNFTIKNTKCRPQTFTVSHVPAGLAQWAPGGNRDNGRYGFAPKAVFAAASITSDREVTIPPGKSVTVEFEVTPPKGIDPATVSAYSGYIRVQSADGWNVFNVPYVGRPYRLEDQPVLDRALSRPEFNQGGAIMPFVYTFSEFPPTSNDLPVVDGMREFNLTGSHVQVYYYSKLMQPCIAKRYNIVKADTSFVPTYYGYDPEVEHPGGVKSEMPTTDNFLGVESVGRLLHTGASAPGIWESAYGFYLGTENGTALPYALYKGDYRWLTRILRFGGDPDNADDYESWLSGIIRVVDHNPYAADAEEA